MLSCTFTSDCLSCSWMSVANSNQAPVIPLVAGALVCPRVVQPMAMRRMTRDLILLDAQIADLNAQLHDSTWDDGELDTIRVEIDQLLDQRQALTNG